MGKILVIAEKPSVAKDIAKVLKCTKKGDGYFYSNEYIISWAVGHLVTLFDPEDYDETLKKWHITTLPIIPEEIKLKPAKKTKPQFDLLKKIIKSDDVDSLICATDSGREGELIFRYIYNLIKSKKPFKRLWISSMTDQAIKEGFANLKDGSFYDNLYKSAKCRSEADWLVGINATRAFTIRYNALLSIGRVQTPTLAIICERQKEINSFVPLKYWEVTAFFSTYKGKWFDEKTNDTKIEKLERAKEIVETTKNKNAIVESINNEEKRQVAPLLYDLTELQIDCNEKFGMSASKTLSIAQDLYEKRKMITYPRTDSKYLSDDMIPKINSTLNKLNNVEKYSSYANYIKNLPKLPITKRIVDNSKINDHHAIIPTDININLMQLSSDELKVYDLIARRFLSAFYPVYIYNITKLVTKIEVENEYKWERFLTKGTTIISLGWKEVLTDDEEKKKTKKAKNKDDEENTVLPKVNINDIMEVKDIVIEDKKTLPPKTYNEASLLSAMENAGRFVEDEALKEQLKDSGLGTPATRASIIERLISVGYIIRNGKILVPTEKGMNLIEIVPTELKSAETTGKWEKALTLIAKGNMDSQKFMNSINKYVAFIITESQNIKTNIVFPKEERFGNTNKNSKTPSLGRCPSCKEGEIYENTKAFFCSKWKEGCKFSMWKSQVTNYSIDLNKDIVRLLLKEDRVEKLQMTLPQTKEKALATLIIKDKQKGSLELLNVERIKE